MIAFSSAIFISALLVFQVQPIIARYILPWYGGTPSVWTTCMLFFQVGLLVGYLYAHFISSHLKPKNQVIVHCCLLILSLISLPIEPQAYSTIETLPQPVQILSILLLAVGFPFVILSSSAPLIQSWFSRIHLDKSPYRLYALSNFGSLLGLLGYPFLVEPNLSLTTQTYTWSTGYILFIFAIMWCGWPLLKGTKVSDLRTSKMDPSISRASGSPSPRSSASSVLSWLLLSACGSAILLAVTNQMCQDVAVIPFLWVLPLSLYLITFIICFERDAWYKRAIWVPYFIVSIAALVYLMRQAYAETEIPLYFQIGIYCSALFSSCMVCHGELTRRKPRTNELTKFYVFISLGGALGGLFVSLIAPLIFVGFWELHLLIVLVSLILVVSLALDKDLANAYRKAAPALGIVAISMLSWQLLININEQKSTSIYSSRSFYGVLHVYDSEPETRSHRRALYHGRISHGEQWRHPSKRALPTAYYAGSSGISYTLKRHPNRLDPSNKEPMKVGVIGLGIGTLAAFGRKNDEYRFYEINPQVHHAAKHYFSYLKDTKAHTSVLIGDGRSVLQEEFDSGGSQNYDVLVVDAFSGDAIPIHLLTKEATDLYWQNLKPDGVLAFHITNFHLDLTDVVRQLAIHSGKEAVYMSFESDEDTTSANSNDWVLVTNNQKFINDRYIKRFRDQWPHTLRDIHWTDNFSNLFDVVMW